MKNILSFIIFGMLVCTCKPSSGNVDGEGLIMGEIIEVSIDRAKEMLEMTDNLVVLDVRSDYELEEGYLPSSINIDYRSSSFRDLLSDLDKEKPYLVYCQTSIRSTKAARIMHEMGFREIYNMKGGYRDWTK